MKQHILKNLVLITYLVFSLFTMIYSHFNSSIISDLAISPNGYFLTYLNYMYVHATWTHYIINTVVLLQLAEYFKNNTTFMMFIFWLGGIVAGLFTQCVHPDIMLVGASGGIVCVYGFNSLGSIFNCSTDQRTNYILTEATIIALFFAGNLFIEHYFNLNISHLTHLFGLLFGYLLAAGFNILKRIYNI